MKRDFFMASMKDENRNQKETGVKVLDCDYLHPMLAASFLMMEGEEAVIVETNTNRATEHILASLSEEGLSPADVRYIIITHVHLDHAGGTGELMRLCPDAVLLTHPRGERHMVDPTRLIESSKQVYGIERYHELYGDILPVPPDRVKTMEDGETLTWQNRTLTFLHTPGHAKHHMVIHDSRSRGVFTGDAFGISYPRFPGSTPMVYPATTPTDFDPRQYEQSMDKILAMNPDRLYLTHFGEKTNIREMSEILKTDLQKFESVLALGAESEKNDEELFEFFVRWMTEYYIGGFEKKYGLLSDEAKAHIQMDLELNSHGLAYAVKKMREG